MARPTALGIVPCGTGHDSLHSDASIIKDGPGRSAKFSDRTLLSEKVAQVGCGAEMGGGAGDGDARQTSSRVARVTRIQCTQIQR